MNNKIEKSFYGLEVNHAFVITHCECYLRYKIFELLSNISIIDVVFILIIKRADSCSKSANKLDNNLRFTFRPQCFMFSPCNESDITLKENLEKKYIRNYGECKNGIRILNFRSAEKYEEYLYNEMNDLKLKQVAKILDNSDNLLHPVIFKDRCRNDFRYYEKLVVKLFIDTIKSLKPEIELIIEDDSTESFFTAERERELSTTEEITMVQTSTETDEDTSQIIDNISSISKDASNYPITTDSYDNLTIENSTITISENIVEAQESKIEITTTDVIDEANTINIAKLMDFPTNDSATTEEPVKEGEIATEEDTITTMNLNKSQNVKNKIQHKVLHIKTLMITLIGVIAIFCLLIIGIFINKILKSRAQKNSNLELLQFKRNEIYYENCTF